MATAAVEDPVSDRLSAADASNIVLDARDQVNVFLMAGLLGPGGFVADDRDADIDALRAAIGERLTRAGGTGLRRLVQRVRADGRGFVWEPCEVDVRQQVRLTAPVAGREGLAGLCASLMTVPMPVDRPLWEVLVVPGASHSGPGVVVRFHHAVSDGTGAVGLLEQLFAAEARPARSVRPHRAGPRPPRSLRTLLKGARRVLAVLRAGVPPTVLLGPISGHRGAAFVDIDLEPLARGARAAGGTVNDALLAAVTRAVEDALAAGGHPVPAGLPASVPVALPDRTGTGNAVGVMRVELPTGEPDATARLARIAATTRTEKSEARAQGTFELTRTRLGSRIFASLARRQRLVALFVTNVRGPAERMSLCGAPQVSAWPLTPIQGNVRLGVSALSYAGRLGCAVHVDADVLDAQAIARTLREQLARIAG
ncbi:MAG TPA: wax ester/triacylglycerol synthase domain-containing protein [Propionibacteriaceae bacterium]|nr:wax ester/triacylglycerol synthase domain-containing protein [Propionibacteriaceae bacterium]